MSELDDMLHRAFANDNPEARFEFREEYWLQAQSLLEADERRRKRLAFWWQALGAALVLGLLVGGGWYLSAPAASTVPAAPTPTQPIASTPAKSGAQPAVQPGLAADKGSQPTSQNIQNQPITTGQPALPSAVSSATTPANRTDSPVVKISATPQFQPKTTQQVASVAPLATNHPLAPETTPTTAVTSNQPTESTPAFAPAATTLPERLSVPVLAALPLELPEALTGPQSHVPVVARVPEPKISVLAGGNSDATASTDVHRRSAWSAGLVGGVATPTGLPGDHQLGLVAGGTVNYHLNRRWSLAADPTLRVRREKHTTYTEIADSFNTSAPGSAFNSGFDQTDVQVAYDFGYNQSVIEEAPSTGLWLEMPVYAQFQFKQLQVTGGVLTSLALLTRKQELEYTSNSLDPVNQLAKSSGQWTSSNDSPYFRSWSVGLTAGLGWAFRPNWAVQLKGSWLPQSYLTSSAKQSALNNSDFDDFGNALNVAPGQSATWFDLRLKWMFARWGK